MLCGGRKTMDDGIVEVNDPSDFLRDQNGSFEVISPYGYIFEVRCRRGSKMEIGPLHELSCDETGDAEKTRMRQEKIWRIRQINAATG
jgi:hypothetical protein